MSAAIPRSVGGISRRSCSSQRLHGSIDHVALGAVLRCFADTDSFGKGNGPREPRARKAVRTASDKTLGWAACRTLKAGLIRCMGSDGTNGFPSVRGRRGSRLHAQAQRSTKALGPMSRTRLDIRSVVNEFRSQDGLEHRWALCRPRSIVCRKPTTSSKNVSY